MARRSNTDRLIAAGVLIPVVAALLLITTVALARHVDLVWVDGLISRVEPRFREMRIWDFRGGTTT